MHRILLGDPSYFRIKEGANPYTRNRWGIKKKVDSSRALYQWQLMKDQLESLGALVVVLPPRIDLSGSCFTANAGFLYENTFYLSSMTQHRKEESAHCQKIIESLGFKVKAVSELLFEGEADFFPCGDQYIFTFGIIRRSGFKPHFGIPPYRYQATHRSDVQMLPYLQKIVAGKEIVKLKLADPRYYHGDTALFSFGKNRELLIAYLPAFDSHSQKVLRDKFSDKLIPITQEEAENFVANSFQLETDKGPHVFLPKGTSQRVRRMMADREISATYLDVSEFFEKGGGSIKCLICDLGTV